MKIVPPSLFGKLRSRLIRLQNAFFYSSSRDALVFVIVYIFGFVLGYWGYSVCDPAITKACQDVDTFQEKAVNTFLLIKGGGSFDIFRRGKPDPWQLWLAQYVLFFTTVGGLFYATLKVSLKNMRSDFRVLMASRKSNHVIVCGLGEIGMALVQNLRAKENQVVVIEPQKDSPRVLACESKGVPVIAGDAADPVTLSVAGVDRAGSLVICTGNDGRNTEIAFRAQEFVDARQGIGGNSLRILAEVRNDWLFEKLLNHTEQVLGSARTEVRFFNTYENTGRMLLKDLAAPPSPDLDAGAFIVIGFGTMGREITQQIIRAEFAPLGQVTQLVICDRDIGRAENSFRANFPLTPNVKVNFIAADLQESDQVGWLSLENTFRSETVRSVIVCLPDDTNSLYVALELRDLLDQLTYYQVPVFVRLQRSRHLGEFASKVEKGNIFGARLRVFGAIEDHMKPDMLVNAKLDALAIAWHEEWTKNQLARGSSGPAVRPWYELAQAYKTSNQHFADHIPIKLAQAKLHLFEAPNAKPIKLSPEEIITLAKIEHRRWVTERELSGWRYSAEHSHVARLHPLLVDWRMLPDKVQKENCDSVAALPSILSALGFQLARLRHVYAFGSNLATAMEAICTPQPDSRYLVFVDIESPGGRDVAYRALELPSRELWIVSSQDPRELVGRQTPEFRKRLEMLIASSNGWCHSERVSKSISVTINP